MASEFNPAINAELREAMIEFFSAECKKNELERLGGKSPEKDWELYKSCITDADDATKVKYGFTIREIFVR